MLQVTQWPTEILTATSVSLGFVEFCPPHWGFALKKRSVNMWKSVLCSLETAQSWGSRSASHLTSLCICHCRSSSISAPCPHPRVTMLSHFSHVRLCVTPWTAAHQVPLSMGFSRQEYWSGCLLRKQIMREMKMLRPYVMKSDTFSELSRKFHVIS